MPSKKKPTTFEDHMRKPCFGKYRCWNNVKRKCPVRTECKSLQWARAKKESI